MANETKQAQHTPGPWIPYVGPMNMDGGLNPFFRGIVALVKNSGEGNEVAVILDRNEDAHDYEANAYLIAAAPDLLTELQFELDWLNRPNGLHRYTNGIHDGDCLACGLRARIAAAIAKASQVPQE